MMLHLSNSVGFMKFFSMWSVCLSTLIHTFLQGPEQRTELNADPSIEGEDNAQQLLPKEHNNNNQHYAVPADICNTQ